MKKLDLTNVTASEEGSFDSLPDGAYACIIKEVNDNPSREYFDVVFDIVAGEHEGYFSTAFYADKPYAHSLIFSYKDAALPMLKGRLNIISDCNTGFDAIAAVNGGQEQLLVGKVMGVVFAKQEYFNRKTMKFEVGEYNKPTRLCRLTALEDENNKSPKPVMLNEKGKIKALEYAKSHGCNSIGDPASWLKSYEAGAFDSAPADAYNGPVPFDM